LTFVAVSSSEVKKRLHEFVISKKQRDLALASLSGAEAFKHWLVKMFALFFTPPSGRGLVNTLFFCVPLFFRGLLPQTSSFCSAKQILVVSFVTQARACILSDHNIFYTPRGGRTTAGSNAPGAFLVCERFSRLVS